MTAEIGMSKQRAIVAAPSQRLLGLDPLRVIAAYAVIWIHTPQSAELAPSVALGRAAVPFFLGTSVLLILRSLWRERGAEATAETRSPKGFFFFAAMRCRRLLFPFAAWSVVYLALKVAKKVVAPHQPNDFPGWEAVLVGTAYHLWFLPYLLVVSLVTYIAGRSAFRRRNTLVSAVLATIFGISFASMPCPNASGLPDAFSFMWLATPGVCWTYALALFYVRKPTIINCRNSEWFSMGAFIVLFAATALLWQIGRNATLEATAGIAMLVLAVSLTPSAWLQPIAVLAPLSLGIYLSHLLILKIAETVASRLDWNATPVRDYAFFMIAAFCSTTLAYVLSKFRSTRWLVSQP